MSDLLVPLLLNSSADDKQKFIDEARRGDGDYAFQAMLGINAIFVSGDELRALVKDEEGFLRYVVGPYLAANPHITYEKFLREANLVGKHDISITAEQFAAYRYQGFVWIESVKARPENRVLAERTELFLKRSGLTDLSDVSAKHLLPLLMDDEALEKFLTDDDFARLTMEEFAMRSELEPMDVIWNLGPPYTGVTPGTAS